MVVCFVGGERGRETMAKPNLFISYHDLHDRDLIAQWLRDHAFDVLTRSRRRRRRRVITIDQLPPRERRALSVLAGIVIPRRRRGRRQR